MSCLQLYTLATLIVVHVRKKFVNIQVRNDTISESVVITDCVTLLESKQMFLPISCSVGYVALKKNICIMLSQNQFSCGLVNCSMVEVNDCTGNNNDAIQYK